MLVRPTGGNYRAPQTSSWLSGSRFAAGEGEREEKEENEEKGRG